MKNFDEAVNNLINMFKNEDFPQKLALTIIKRVDEGIPSDKWSITNKLIMLLLGNTTDARGYKQWQEAGRHIKKGEKAFYILAPNTKKIKNEISITNVLNTVQKVVEKITSIAEKEKKTAA